jgi:hypothetical protein
MQTKRQKKNPVKGYQSSKLPLRIQNLSVPNSSPTHCFTEANSNAPTPLSNAPFDNGQHRERLHKIQT